MKVTADFDRCVSNAVCVGIAPDVFEIDEDNYLQFRTDEVTEDNEARIREAVRSCPTSALSLTE